MKSLGRIVVLFLTMNFAYAGFGAAQDESGAGLPGFRQAVRKAKPAVVYIEARTKARRGQGGYGESASGSGVIIDGVKGYVLTAAHVVDGADEVVVRLEDGRKFTAKNKWSDMESDVGLVQIEGENLPQAVLGDSDELEVGDWVLAIGSPFGRALENSVSAGVVSAKGRKTGILGQMGVEDFIQTDAVINRGNSGGPLVNIKGEVVGINSNIISSSGMSAGLGFAVPSKLAGSAIAQLTTKGKVERGYMGVSLANLSDLAAPMAEKIPESVRQRGGAYLAVLVPGGPADEAGLKQGDIILRLADKEITSVSDLVEHIRLQTPDVAVKCLFWRDGKTKTAEVTLAERPSNEQVAAEAQGDVTTYAYRTLGIMASDWSGAMVDGGRVTRIRGMMVDYVKPGSPGDRAGVRPGDFIDAVDGKKVPNGGRFEAAMQSGDLKKGISLRVIDQSGEKVAVVKK